MKKAFIIIAVLLISLGSQFALADSSDTILCTVNNFQFELPAGATETESTTSEDGVLTVDIDLSIVGTNTITVTNGSAAWDLDSAKKLIERAIAIHEDANIESDIFARGDYYKGYVITKDDDTYLGSVIASSEDAYVFVIFAYNDDTKSIDEEILHRVFASIKYNDEYSYTPLSATVETTSSGKALRDFDSINRKNPVKLDEEAYFTFSSSEITVHMNVASVIKGEEALQAILAENKYNDVPEDGQEYYLVTIHLSMTCDEEKRLEVDQYDFEHVSTMDWQAEDMSGVSGINNEVTLYPDGNGDLQIAFMADKDVPQMLLYEEEIWFALD